VKFGVCAFENSACKERASFAPLFIEGANSLWGNRLDPHVFCGACCSAKNLAQGLQRELRLANSPAVFFLSIPTGVI
jgi:hypothetical protein